MSANIVKCPIEMVSKSSTKIVTDNAKYNMYINALPTVIRQRIFDQKINPQIVYNEYRKIGKDKIVEKYSK